MADARVTMGQVSLVVAERRGWPVGVKDAVAAVDVADQGAAAMSLPTYGIERGLEPPCATCAGTGTAYPARGLDPPCPVCEGTGIVAICGVVCAAGRDGEPLACGFKKGHDGKHAWASLPTFVKVGGVPVEKAGLQRVERALKRTTLSGAPEATAGLRDHAGNLAQIALYAYFKDAR